MMIKLKKILYVLVSILPLLSTGCHRKDSPQQEPKMRLVATDRVMEFDIDPRTYPHSDCVFAHHTGTGERYLVYLNEQLNRIQFYLIDSLRLSHTIELQQKGPHGVGLVIGYYVQSLDSVFVTPKGRKQIFLVNRKGELIGTWDYSRYLSGSGMSVMATYSRPVSPLVIIGHELYIDNYPEGNWNLLNRDNMKAFPLMMKLDMETGTVTEFDLRYPFPCFEMNDINHSRIWDGERFLWSFRRDPVIYASKDLRTMQEFHRESRYIKKLVPDLSSGDFMELIRYGASAPSYEKLIHDPFRGLYYRVVYPGTKVDKDMNISSLMKFKPVFSVMILDRDLNTMGETLVLPENHYYMKEMFVLKEGLYISENHIQNPSFNENKLRYRLFHVEQLF
ncbi:MAG: DUF4221 family protein [Bacteroidales bacterium]